MMSQVVAHCLVDGCNADLSLCRDYHRRHKVCEMHSKTPKVTIAGREQRFCQQCSRFHSLVEFDEGKRSCRKRLDGHNRRRRKPQSDSLVSRNPSGLHHNNVFSTQQASAPLISFSSSPRMLPPVVGNNDMLVYQKQLNDSSFPEHSYNGAGVVSQLHLLQNSLVDQVVDCGRALSLLSSEATPEFGLNHVSTSHGNMMHYCGLGQNDNPILEISLGILCDLISYLIFV